MIAGRDRFRVYVGYKSDPPFGISTVLVIDTIDLARNTALIYSQDNYHSGANYTNKIMALKVKRL